MILKYSKNHDNAHQTNPKEVNWLRDDFHKNDILFYSIVSSPYSDVN